MNVHSDGSKENSDVVLAGLLRQLDAKPADSSAAKHIEKSRDGVDVSGGKADDEAVGKPPSPRRLFFLSRPEWPALFRAMLVSGLCILVDALAPALNAIVQDALIDQSLKKKSLYGVVEFNLDDDREALVRKFTLIIIVLRCVSLVLGIAKGITFGIVSARVVTRLRLRLFCSILSHDMEFFDTRTSGELSSRLGTDAQQVQSIASGAVPDLTMAFIKIVVLTIMMFAQSYELSLMLLGLIPLMFAWACPFIPVLIKLNRRYQDVVAKSSNISTQAISNLRVVRVFGSENFTSRLYIMATGDVGGLARCPCSWWPGPAETMYRVGVLKSIVQGLATQGTIAIGASGLTAILWYAYDMIIEGRITYGRVGAFTMYGMMIMMQCAFVGKIVASLAPAMGAAQRIFEIIDRKPKIEADVGKTLFELKGDIAFENVSFAYPTRPSAQIFNTLSFIVPSQSKAAFVGGSGTGKTTILALLQRLYDVSGGRVVVDGYDVRTLHAQWLRRRLGSVQQEPVLFGFSIRENLAYGCLAAAVAEGKAEPSDEDIIQAAKAANAHEFISSFPDGYNTLVGERGVRLSGGQKQRIAIARTILCNPCILLLDEATSALDSESEFLIQQALDRLMANRTVLIVAHRLSTVVDADQIIVMTKGGIAGSGKHDQLLVSCTVYRELIQHQLDNKTLPTYPGQAREAAMEQPAEQTLRPIDNTEKTDIGTAHSRGDVSLAVGASNCLDSKRLEQIVLQNNVDAAKPANQNANGKDAKKEAAPRAPASFLLKLMGPEVGVLMFACLFTLSATAIEAYLPVLQGQAVDWVVGDFDIATKKTETSRLMIMALIGGVVVQVVHYVRVGIASVAGERVVARTRLWVFNAIFEQDMAFFDAQTTGDLTSRLVNDAQMVQMAAASSFIEVVVGLAKGIMGLAMSMVVSWRLSLLTLASFAAILCLFLPFIGPLMRIYRKSQAATGRSVNVSTEVTSSMKTVIAFGSEGFVDLLYGAAVGQLDGPGIVCWWPIRSQSTYRYSVYMSVGMKVAMQVALFLAQLCFCLIMWYAYTRILDGDLSFGQIYSFTVYAMNILAGFSGAGLGVGGVFAALGALGRIHEIWSREPAVPISNGLRPDGLEMKVKFNDVSFSYPSRPETLVLQGVSLEVPVGTSAAFVGSSGCGKSTMLQLISRFYDVHSGVVSLGDFDIRELDASWLRRRIGVVQQEPVLFGFNVHSNIAYGRNAMHLIEGKPLPTQEEIEHAAELANVHGFVSELPDKYETLVGERGVLLSGGQKQRVAIARALLMDPKMLLLDEATSALDSASEHHVQDAIDNASRGRTVIVVAHRLSTVRDADQIFVMDGGRIVDVGKHEVLLEKCERYRELVFRQDSAEKCRGEANASEISGEVGEAHL